jgi:hypothetical protein
MFQNVERAFVKIALCIPCHGDTKAKFTVSLANMITHTLGARIETGDEPVKIEFETFLVACSLLPESRNRLVAEAWNWGADYMLWMDADHVFPCDALLQLLSRNQLVVGCNYARRFSPTSPTASKYGDDDEMDLVWTTKEKAEAGELEEVAHLGLGLCLVDMRVFDILQAKAEADGKEHFWPLFRMDPTPDGIRFVGEDVHFFKSLRDAGVPIHLDHRLSWDVGHVSEQILTNAHTVVQKDQFIEFSKSKMKKFEERVNGK